MKCKNCGADVSGGDSRCHYCGATVEAPPPRGRREVFQQILNSTAYANRESAERIAALPKYPAIAKILPFFVVGAFILLVMYQILFMNQRTFTVQSEQLRQRQTLRAALQPPDDVRVHPAGHENESIHRPLQPPLYVLFIARPSPSRSTSSS